MNEKNIEGLQRLSALVRSARERLDTARTAYGEAEAELRSAEEAVRVAEDKFSGFAWGAFDLQSPLERWIGKPKDREAASV